MELRVAEDAHRSVAGDMLLALCPALVQVVPVAREQVLGHHLGARRPLVVDVAPGLVLKPRVVGEGRG